jgi:hypothetical protein
MDGVHADQLEAEFVLWRLVSENTGSIIFITVYCRRSTLLTQCVYLLDCSFDC